MTEETNPYRSPLTDVSEATANRAIVLASKGRRFGTFVVDYICFIVVSFCSGVLIALTFGEAGVGAMAQIPDMVLGWIVFALYYIFFEGLWARTPGKLLFGTVVVNQSGGRPSLGQVVGRTLCRLIPFEAFSCLGERGWHDSIPKTYVVLARAL